MLVWEVTVYLKWMSEGMEHDTSFPNKGLIELPSVNLQASTQSERQVALLGSIGLL